MVYDVTIHLRFLRWRRHYIRSELLAEAAAQSVDHRIRVAERRKRPIGGRVGGGVGGGVGICGDDGGGGGSGGGLQARFDAPASELASLSSGRIWNRNIRCTSVLTSYVYGYRRKL